MVGRASRCTYKSGPLLVVFSSTRQPVRFVVISTGNNASSGAVSEPWLVVTMDFVATRVAARKSVALVKYRQGETVRDGTNGVRTRTT